MKNLFIVKDEERENELAYRVRQITLVTYVSNIGNEYSEPWAYEFFYDQGQSSKEIELRFKTKEEANLSRKKLIKMIEAQED